MTTTEKDVLSAECIGITALNLGIAYNPPLDECFTSFELALQRAHEIHVDLKTNDILKKILFSR